MNNPSVITIVGNEKACIENYRSIIEISENRIKLITKLGQVTLLGQHLCIEYYNEADLLVTGYILKVEL